MKTEVYQQNICSNCLQMLVNGESDHTEEELTTMGNTLNEWSKTGYTPAGLSDNMESSFSWHKCDLCNCLAGDRYEYNFFQTIVE
jgi:hypothetical protein